MKRTDLDDRILREFLSEAEDEDNEEGGEEGEAEAEEEEEEPEAEEEESPEVKLDSVLDSEIDSVLIDFEKDSLTSEEPEQKSENFVFKAGIRVLLEEDAGGFEDKIDMSHFSSEVARLVKNYQNLLDMEKLLVSKAEEFILKKYGEEAAQKLIKTLEDTHDIKVGETKKIETSAQIPLAVGASQEAASG